MLDHFSTLILVAGLSGAGKSTASHTLNDIGFFTVDHLPVALLPNFLEVSRSNADRYRRTAILFSIDAQERMDELHRFIKGFGQPRPSKLKLLFLDARTETIIRRYSETRRPHPGFDAQRDKTLSDAIQRERSLLSTYRDVADWVVDSTDLNTHQLKREIRTFVETVSVETAPRVRLNFISFGFKYGVPLDCDLVVDVRFLPNPFFIEELREHTGLSSQVQEFVMSKTDAQQFLDLYSNLLNFLLPKYIYEGKSYINIGVGCTGGKHRSVVLANALSKRVTRENLLVSVKHRDVGKE